MVGNSWRGKVALNLNLTDVQVVVRTAATIWSRTVLRIGIPAMCIPIFRGNQSRGLPARINPAWYDSEASGTDVVTPARCLCPLAARLIDCQPDLAGHEARGIAAPTRPSEWGDRSRNSGAPAPRTAVVTIAGTQAVKTKPDDNRRCGTASTLPQSWRRRSCRLRSHRGRSCVFVRGRDDVTDRLWTPQVEALAVGYSKIAERQLLIS